MNASTRQPWQRQELPESQVGPMEARLKGLTTHLSCWPAATSFLRWLEEREISLGLDRPGLRIIELGSGTGWFGRNLSANLMQSAPMVLSDRAEAIQQLMDNCRDFKSGQAFTSVSVELLDWRDWAPTYESTSSLPTGGPFDLILGSDLIWTQETAATLPWAVKALLEDGKANKRDTMALYGHWNRSPKLLPIFMEVCALAGVVATCCAVEPDVGRKDESSLQSDPLPLNQMLADSDGDLDWFAMIFDDIDAKAEVPVFVVYSLALQARM